MTWIVLVEKSYHEWRGRPSSIGDGGGLPISGWNLVTSNNGGESFGNGGNNALGGSGSDPLGGGGSGLLRGGDNSPLGGNDNDILGGRGSGLLRGGGNSLLGGGGNSLIGGGGSGPLVDQNPRSYGVGPIGLWIGPIWNSWYPSWYHV
jgi:hypothetical protein